MLKGLAIKNAGALFIWETKGLLRLSVIHLHITRANRAKEFNEKGTHVHQALNGSLTHYKSCEPF